MHFLAEEGKMWSEILLYRKKGEGKMNGKKSKEYKLEIKGFIIFIALALLSIVAFFITDNTLLLWQAIICFLLAVILIPISALFFKKVFDPLVKKNYDKGNK